MPILFVRIYEKMYKVTCLNKSQAVAGAWKANMGYVHGHVLLSGMRPAAVHAMSSTDVASRPTCQTMMTRSLTGGRPNSNASTVHTLSRKGFDSLVLLAVWTPWKERNARVFDHKAKRVIDMTETKCNVLTHWSDRSGFKLSAISVGDNCAVVPFVHMHYRKTSRCRGQQVCRVPGRPETRQRLCLPCW
jgi:hypothetical protein